MIITTNILLSLELHYYLFMINTIVSLLAMIGMFLHAKEFIFFFLCNELFIFSIILNLLLLGGIYDDLVPQVFVFFILATSSAEIVIGLSIIVSFYKTVQLNLNNIELSSYKLL